MITNGHACHALGCSRPCPNRHLMCADCWMRVPHRLQLEVYRTVAQRHRATDATWAPWWQAQAHARHHVAKLQAPNDPSVDAWLAAALRVAARLADRGTA